MDGCAGEPDFQRWGLEMQDDDLTDAVQYAIRAGIADAKRICIIGSQTVRLCRL